MRGIGGPLLSIGDLLADLGEESGESPEKRETPASDSTLGSDTVSGSLDLTRLFQENYDKLNKAFAGSDHSWTALTLELCTALETANKLVNITYTNARLLSEKVEELENVMKRGDSAVAAARIIHASLNQKGSPSHDG
ncbi:PREDICTED: uncharacterized protein LOC104817138 [Tarenaya hassleriana]|uniref:uncharacterized protein LOC104817138 n=1 Tax=Tarenaya hassleriana TaxID=28532 RepID=UPI00053C1E64|nr:PREDICTED: uncharacterized protein LOC104817138 [Tarenaya hassleriana]XP_010544523.1 PREDICTED: uncharacterized protein LOC104817138 [Tarenaya hassleriana]